MLISDHALLLAIGFSGLCIAVILLVTWFSTRSEPFLLTWVASTFVIICCAFGFAAYGLGLTPWIGAVTFGAMVVGMGMGLAAALQYRTGRLHVFVLLPVVLVATLVVVNPMLAGYNGLAIIIADAAAAAFLGATAIVYWSARAEAPRALAAMALLYLATGVVFALSCAVLIADGELVLRLPPRNWAETLGRSVSVVTIIGIGSLALALNHWRMEKRREQATLTDGATGLLNRRALFEIYERHAPLAHSALVIFGLDDFKTLAGQHGEEAVEPIVGRFVATLARESGEGDIVARLAGDEFALILLRSSPDAATEVAERVSTAFGNEPIAVGWETVRCRVSAGIAFSGETGGAFEDVMRTARDALAAARRDDRKRVAAGHLAMAGGVFDGRTPSPAIAGAGAGGTDN